MIARLGEAVARRWTTCAAALRRSRHLRLDPTLSLQLKKLLPHGFAGELQFVGELRDGGGSLLLQREQDCPPAIGKLVYGKDDVLLWASF